MAITDREQLWDQFHKETGRKFTDKDAYVYYADWLETKFVALLKGENPNP